jgi:predicted translin family RNA/ssDNA-binding protein
MTHDNRPEKEGTNVGSPNSASLWVSPLEELSKADLIESLEATQDQLEALREELTEYEEGYMELKVKYDKLQPAVPRLVDELKAYMEHLKTEYVTPQIRETVERTALYSFTDLLDELR